MYKAIARNKRNTTIFIIVFVLLFIILAVPFAFLGYNEYNAGYMEDSWIYFGISVGILAISGIYAFVQYFFSSKWAVASVGGKPISREQAPELYQIVHTLSIGYGIPEPPIYIIEDKAPNAFAAGRDPEHAIVAVTTGILDLLNKRELEGVLSHELSHIKNYDVRVSTIIFGLSAALTFISISIRQFGWAIMRGGRGNSKGASQAALVGVVLYVVGLVASIIMPIVGLMLQLAVSRQREYLADTTGSEYLQSPDGLISALNKLRNVNTIMPTVNPSTAHLFFASPLKGEGFTSKMFETHPPLEDRIRRLMGSFDDFHSDTMVSVEEMNTRLKGLNRQHEISHTSNAKQTPASPIGAQ